MPIGRSATRPIRWIGTGFCGDALRARTVSDYDVAIGKAGQLREAATIARRGAGDISAAQRRVMYTMQDAQNAGFTVEQDLSVTDVRRGRSTEEQAARQAQAQTFAADIRSRATALAGLDHEVGANITAVAGHVGTTTFAEKPSNCNEKEGRAVDHWRN